MNQQPATSLRIALIGYGKMGKAIESIALQNGHQIGLIIDLATADQLTAANLSSCDVAIEFTHPDSAPDNILACLKAGIPVVSGSTGWLHRWNEIAEACTTYQGSLLYASNFSVGVNVFFELNKYLAHLMNQQTSYDVSLEEIHHTQKKDAPSGTAITLAEQILAEIGRKKSWVNHTTSTPDELAIQSLRIDPAPGTHKILYSSPIDDIEIIHTAHNRTGFATGAVMAASFLVGKKGIYSMKDVLGF